VAVRLALGISRGRLARLLLLESTLRALLGGAAALGVAWVCGQLVRRTLLPDIAWPSSPVDGRVLAFTAGAALLTGVVVGLTPLHLASRTRLGDMTNASRTGGGRRGRLRFTLTAAQAALSVVLLVGAGLFVRSLLQVGSLRLGMEPERILAVSVNWPSLSGVADSAARAERASREGSLERSLDRVRALPGVAHAAIAVGTPFRSRFTIFLRVPGWDSLPRLAGGGPYIAAVSPDYFATLGTRLRQGRDFTAADRAGSERVAIVNETMARTLWAGRTPLGECLYVGATDTTRSLICSRIVGVVEDVRRSALREEPAMQYFVPLGQEEALGFGGRQLLVRPRGAPAPFTATLRRELLATLPGALFVNVQPYTSFLDGFVRPWRLGAALFGAFGLLALVVAGLGIHSVMSYMVAQRAHELGVRRALGAGAAHLLRIVVGQGLAAVAAGCAIGLTIALVAGRFLEAVLFDTAASDRVVLATVTLAMLLAALVASVVPARRAARIDPATALRGE
jgi:predicted permease